MWSRKARVYPYPSDSATATTLNGAISSATATTITVTSTSGFKSQGRVLIDSEVVSYTGITSTTLTGCTRGDEETTAATHSTAVAVTERDFIYHFQEDPDELDSDTDETSIPNPSILAYQAAAELAPEKDDSTLHDRMILKFERAYKQLVKADEAKYKSTFGRVKDESEVVSDSGMIRDPNQYPTDLS